MLDATGDGKTRNRETTASRAKGGLLVAGGFVAALFVIELINMLTLHSLNRTFGLRPRSADGLLDILTFPLLHANLNHLLSNALPLIVFGFLVFLSGVRVFLTALGFSWLGSGLTVWLIGDGGITVGASGLVFGLFAFLLVRVSSTTAGGRSCSPWCCLWSTAASCWVCCQSWAATSPGRRTSAGRQAEL
ncbi:uncharacterized protein Mb1372 [Arthrobacter sp. Hiyo4]|nr:uncharacterized protein Mb1372 [Arthrobacter sp. Hiyo4]